MRLPNVDGMWGFIVLITFFLLQYNSAKIDPLHGKASGYLE